MLRVGTMFCASEVVVGFVFPESGADTYWEWEGFIAYFGGQFVELGYICRPSTWEVEGERLMDTYLQNGR